MDLNEGSLFEGVGVAGVGDGGGVVPEPELPFHNHITRGRDLADICSRLHALSFTQFQQQQRLKKVKEAQAQAQQGQPLVDEWGDPLPAQGDNKDWGPVEGGRKRKAMGILSISSGSLDRKCSRNEEIDRMGALYESIRDGDEKLLELVFEFMPDEQLRNHIPSVSSEWCRLAYKVLRRRSGNGVFSLLYAVCPSQRDISFEMFFHPSFVCLDPSGITAFDSLDGMACSKVAAFKAQGKEVAKPGGYLERLASPDKVQGIICFGTVQMEQEVLYCDEAGELPLVDVFMYILSDAVSFTTPDLRKVGGSSYGFDSKEIQYSKTRRKCLSSLLFPESPYFALGSCTFSDRHGCWSLDEKHGRNMFSHLTTKALVVFKTEACSIDGWIQTILNKAFDNGSVMVPVIQSVGLVVGTTLMKPQTRVSAVAISIMGNDATTLISVEFDLTAISHDTVNLKFSQMSSFIKGELVSTASTKRTESIFALMFCYLRNGVASESNAAFAPMNELMKMFHDRFPSVPAQAITSMEELQYKEAVPSYMDVMGLNQKMEKLMSTEASAPTPGHDKAVFLIVKYPLDP